MNDLDEQLRAYYGEQRLDSNKVDTILEAGAIARRPWWRRPQAAMAALLVVGLFSALLVWISADRAGTSKLAYAVAKEVAKSHEKGLAPEVITQSYATLQAKLDRVPFALKSRNPVVAQHCELLGGRYCSIQGELAAQLRLQDKESGELYTLFVAEETPELARLAEGDQWIGKANVRFWSEGGRFYALAGPRGP